jgi:hypothetical protein
VTLIVVSLALAFFLNRHLGSPDPARFAKRVAQHVKAGRAALARGQFKVAGLEFDAALRLSEQRPESVTPPERRQLTQLRRQVELLADLLSESLGDILSHAADLTRHDDQEWRQVFADRYRGKAVVFDADVHCDASGTYYLDYAVLVRGKPAKLDLANIHLFRFLPLQQSQRLLLGLRLAAVRPEAEGAWVIQFDPDSAVLLTDLDTAVAGCLQPAEDLEEVVNRQADWLAHFVPSPDQPVKESKRTRD